MAARAKHKGGSLLGLLGPDLNAGKDWSELDLSDLKACSEQGDSVTEAASFLCRSREETRAKADELGLTLHWQNRDQKERAAKRYRAGAASRKT
jgi:hypothetical protein